MLQHIEIANLVGLRWLAQVPVESGLTTANQAAYVFSGPRFFVALISGVVLAFALQLVLTNLSLAVGISYLGRDSDPDEHGESDSFGTTIRKIGVAVGLWTLVTVTVALFIACLLAVKLSLIPDPALGAIVGLVIWATYFSGLVWVSSSTVASLIGSVFNTATAGFQSLLGTASAALGAKAASNQVVATAEAAASAVRRELTSGLDAGSIRDTVEDYLDRLRLPELDFSKIRQEFEGLLNQPELRSVLAEGELSHINRDTFVNLVSSRTDLSKQDINRLADQLEGVWRNVAGQAKRQQGRLSEVIDYLRSAPPEQLRSNELSTKVEQLIEELRQQRSAGGSAENKQPSLMDRAIQMGSTALTGVVMGRTDLSDLDLEKILHQLQGVKEKVSDQANKLGSQVAEKVPALPFNAIRADVENYLSNSYPWHFNRETLRQEFQDVIYDPQADPGTVRRQLEQMNRGDFVNLLSQRGDLSSARVTEIADQLETIRAEVLSTVRTAESQETSEDLRTRVENYLRSTNKEELNPDGIARDFKTLLHDPEAGIEQLRDRLSHFDRDTLVTLIKQRSDLSAEESAQLLVQLENTRDQVLGEAQSLQEQAQSKVAELQQRMESYLRNTGRDELNPEGIKRDFRALLEDPQVGILMLRSRLSHFDRNTFVQLLSQRQDISQEDANRIADQLTETWYSTVHAPQILTDKAKEQYDKTTTAIAEYLRGTNLPELDPTGIQRDLDTLLHDPKEGAIALRQRLAQVDRETLVKLLSQRQDLTEEQVNQIIDRVQEAIRNIIRAPRRLARRTQQRVYDFRAMLEDYLRNTGKDELNPDDIKRDLQLLLNDPRAGVGSLSERLSHFDRSTIVALLSQRQDITEEDASRIVDQVLSVRDQIMEQIHNIQNRIQSVIDSIFGRIRDYLNSLERPELNYEGIRRDLRTVFNDPQAGFEALRVRLGSFNRDTLVALLSSREDISEAHANRIIDQIEAARVSVLQRAERLQQDAQLRLEEVKHQAQKQVEETRKAAASAARWLFATAAVSAGFSVLAGWLAVVTAAG